MKTLHKLRLWQQIVLVCCTFTLPVAIGACFITSEFNKDIEFARLEQSGNRYQRPLEQLLESLPKHQDAARRSVIGAKTASLEMSSAQAQIDKGFEAWQAVDQEIGASLQFTAEGLAKRKREHVQFATVKREWQELRDSVGRLSQEASDKLHSHLVADVRTIIMHAGDTSNLILDPDLDSYYLMDATLVTLPQTQDRLAVIQAFAQSVLAHKPLPQSEQTQLAVQMALLKEADVDRATADIQTALNEDQNFYGVSETLQRDLPPAVKDYAAANQALLDLTAKLISPSGETPASPEEYARTADRARVTSFALWQTGVIELDRLLDKRLGHLQRMRALSLASTLLALLGSSLFGFFVLRAITQALQRIVRTVDAGAENLASAIAQISESSGKLASSTSQQAASLQETSSGLKEIAAMTAQNVAHAGKARDLAGQAHRAATVGTADMLEMKAAMDGIKLSNVGISKIIRLMDEIAFQTNILALNAAVEAARAGEAGLGFAVVANEVRTLAQRSKKAAAETAEQIEASIQKGDVGLNISLKVADSLQNLLARTKQVDDVIVSISSACGQQRQGIDQLNSAVGQMDRVTQTNAASAEETSGVLSGLEDDVAQLRSGVLDMARMVGSVKGQ
jgi:methyl-accepting chemotaxis protein